MADEVRSQLPEPVAALAADPQLGRLLGRGAAVVLWRIDGRIAWSSPAARGLAHRMEAASESPAMPRLRALAGGVAPRDGLRLERLRFSAGGLAPVITAACRLIDGEDGEPLLLTVLTGPLPGAPEARPAAAPPASRDKAPPAEPAPARAEAAAPLVGKRTVRFLWQADGEGRFTFVSPALAESVGPGTAALAGRRFDELPPDWVRDPSGAVAEAFRRQETFSGCVVSWRIDGSEHRVEVELAGLPTLDRDRRLTGFRGFGLVRTAQVTHDPPVEPAGRAEGAADAGADPEPEAPPIASDQQADETSPPDSPVPAAGPEPTVESEPETVMLGDASADVAAWRQDAGEAPRVDPVTVTSTFGGLTGWAAARLDAPAPTPLRLIPVARAAAPEPPRDPLPPSSADPSSGEAEQAVPDEARPPVPGPEHAPKPSVPRLSVAERSAFREIARALGARFEDEPEAPPPPRPAPPAPAPAAVPRPEPDPTDLVRFLDRLPVGLLLHRGEVPLVANRAFLDLVGYDGLDALTAVGVGHLFRGRSQPAPASDESGSPLLLTHREGGSIAVDARLTTADWQGLPASLMLVRRASELETVQRLRALELEQRGLEARNRELTAILDTATDGVVLIDESSRILALNRSAEALFGYDQNEVAGEPFAVLLAPESQSTALDYLEGLKANGVASLLNDGRDVQGRVRQGGFIPLFMTMGRIADGPERKFCAVLRDITAFKKTEGELIAARRAAEAASAQKSDFLARISHEIRTPLNAIIGFAEVILEERFGAIGNERYKDYLRDIHASGQHVISLVNDLLDLAKIEAGRMELAFTSVSLSEAVTGAVALLQPQAARSRIVIRTSFTPRLPPVVADERSIRQIVLNIVSNAIKFTEAGGQVIISTALTDRGEATLRVRDTGIGMSEEEVEAALEPFRQVATARKSGGTGLGLPLTKALVEANRGALRIVSRKNEGTLVEVVFPPTRVLAN